MTIPETKITLVSNLWVRQMHFVNAGDQNEGHKHTFDHITLLAKGSVEVDVEGQKTVFKAPHMIYIMAGKQHFLRALESDTVAYCVHALRTGEKEEDIIDPAMIPEGVRNFMLPSNVRPL